MPQASRDSIATPSYIPSLDGMRGVAAVLVLLYHVSLYFSLDKGMLDAARLSDHLYLAVDCFYVLSGFIIAHSFDHRMERGTSFGNFMIRRFIRLYPMIAIGVAIGCVPIFAFWYLQPGLGAGSIVSCILSGLMLFPTSALTDYKPYAFPVNSPHWSLSFEVLLYAAYALSYRYQTPRRLFAAAVLSGALLLATSYCAGGLNIGFFWSDYALGFGRVAYPFLAGIILRRFMMGRHWNRRWGYAAVPLLVVILINPIPVGWLYDAVVDLAVLPPLIWWCAGARSAKAFDRPAALAGDLSYPIYAIHFPLVLLGANASRIAHLGTAANAIAALLTTVAIVLAARTIQLRVDKPVRGWLTQTLLGKPALAPMKVTSTT